ncbi:MAG: hypothetical protein M3R25_09220, partial [Bacteroidota bacterium]|nr:hypothetical protein [Bacteroidota bacterium]
MNQRTLSVAIIILIMASFGRLSAEGTGELAPTPQDSVMLHTNAPGFGNFASFTSDSMHRLYVSIEDFTNEILYIGLSAEHNDFGQLDAGSASYMFQIRGPSGAIVFGPILIGAANDNATTWLQASSGPDVLDPVNGYSTNTSSFPYSTFVPTSNGDYSMEFFDGGTIANIMWYDFTVVSGGTEQPGRLWSHNWALRSPPRNPNQLPECQFDRSFEGVFYSYTEDGFVSRIDFANSGFQGLSFTVAFGDSGPGNTGDVMADRRSVNDMNATANAADHKVFLNDPDITLYPSSLSQCGAVTLLNVSCEAPDSFCINVGVTRPGQVDIILDFNQNGVFDMNSQDVLIVDIFPVADTACFPWNGLKGDGTPIAFGEDIPAIIKYFQGVQHYSAFDVEFLKNGFCVQTIRPICSGVATDLLYWDDSQITDDVVTVTIDEGDPGTGQPKIQFNGCQCGTGGCRTWTT